MTYANKTRRELVLLLGTAKKKTPVKIDGQKFDELTLQSKLGPRHKIYIYQKCIQCNIIGDRTEKSVLVQMRLKHPLVFVCGENNIKVDSFWITSDIC